MSSDHFTNLTVVQFIEKQKEGAIVIDLRTPGEIQSGKIDNALEIDCLSADFGDRVISLDRTKSYLLYCRSGHRSGQVLEVFRSLGFQNAHHLGGGILEWIRLGNRVR